MGDTDKATCLHGVSIRDLCWKCWECEAEAKKASAPALASVGERPASEDELEYIGKWADKNWLTDVSFRAAAEIRALRSALQEALSDRDEARRLLEVAVKSIDTIAKLFDIDLPHPPIPWRKENKA